MEMVSDSIGTIIDHLTRRGWWFRNNAEIRELITNKFNTEENTVSWEDIETELLNMDLRLVGAKSLPDPSNFKRHSHLQGPKILQVNFVKDVGQSTIEASATSLQHHRRLLRFCLTDGFSEVIAIEYTPISLITKEIIPGNKVRLENNTAIRSGIICLEPKMLTILGGHVQSIYEEWEMTQKYSGFSRLSLRSQNNGFGGPPPFERLEIGAFPQRTTQQPRLHLNPSSSKQTDQNTMKLGGCFQEEKTGGTQGSQSISRGHENYDSRSSSRNDEKLVSTSEIDEDKPISSDSRAKEIAEAVPVQNQAAAQKLLQRMNQPTNQHSKFGSGGGPKHRGKGRQEEPTVFTLEEWERGKGASKALSKSGHQDISHDEELARQLQNQLDLEDYNVNLGSGDAAEKIRMSMFNFGRGEETIDFGQGDYRGRGSGRGKRGF